MTVFVAILSIATYAGLVHTVLPPQCLANFRWDDCGKPPRTVIYYWRVGSRCEVGIWRGCLPNMNMFRDEYECVSTCTFSVRAGEHDFHQLNYEEEDFTTPNIDTDIDTDIDDVETTTLDADITTVDAPDEGDKNNEKENEGTDDKKEENEKEKDGEKDTPDEEGKDSATESQAITEANTENENPEEPEEPTEPEEPEEPEEDP